MVSMAGGRDGYRGRALAELGLVLIAVACATGCGGTEHATGGTQHASGGTQHATGGTQHATGGTQHATGGTQHGSGGFRDAGASAHATRFPAPRGRVLVVFKRAVGVDPLASYYKLYADGAGVATVVYGGRDGARVHAFALRPARVRRLARLLGSTRLEDAPIANPNLYTYWVVTRGGSFRLQQGTIPRTARPLLRELNAIADENTIF
jgi:hypothetical protein